MPPAGDQPVCLLQAAPCSRVDAFPCQPLPRLLPAQGGSAGPWLGCSSPAPSRGGVCARGGWCFGGSGRSVLLGDSLTLLRLSACGAAGWSLQPPLVAHTHPPPDQAWWQAVGSLWGSPQAEGGGSQCPCLSSAEPLPLQPKLPSKPFSACPGCARKTLEEGSAGVLPAAKELGSVGPLPSRTWLLSTGFAPSPPATDLPVLAGSCALSPASVGEGSRRSS